MASADNNIIKILETIETMEKLGLDEASIDKVKVTLSQAAKTTSWKPGQAFSILSEVKNEDERKRQVLVDFYAEAKDFLETIDEQLLNLLQKHVGNVQENMTNHTAQLEQKDYFLLVAGETSSGKSSLVNLMLGEELLPYSVLSTTSTICELKYGEERKLVAHFKDKNPETGEPTKTIILEEPTGSHEQSYLQQIAPYVHMEGDCDRGSIFKKIELFWPHSLLQNGVVIIDSPGVGESDEMDEMVIQYLPQAFAFIYVINCANAGGIQKDRLEKLLQEVQKVSPGVGEQEHLLQEHLLSKCALFVCNKWDQVPPKERETVKNHVIEKLQKLWPGIDLESQIIYISTKNATKVQTCGYITYDFSSLMDGMKSVVLKSIDIRLEIHWRWLDCVLSRIVFQAKAFVMNASRDREKAREMITQILHRLEAIEKQQDKVMADLRKYLNERIDDTVQQLSEYLLSAEVKTRFTTWTYPEIPVGNLEVFGMPTHSVKILLSSRLQEIIQEWEEEHRVFTNARRDLLQYFQQRYSFVEEQLEKIQIAATVDGLGQIDFLKKAWDWYLLKFFVGGYAISIPTNVLGMLCNSLHQNYKCFELGVLALEYLATATHKDNLGLMVQEQFKQAKLFLKQIESRIPELIQADKLLYEELIDESRTKKEVQDLYRPIMDRGSEFRGRLMEFGIKEVCAVDMSAEELEWKEDYSSLLGSGAFGAVYQGTMSRNRNVKTVALKVCSDVLDARNACSLMEEVEILRKLNHPNIVEFYGMSLLRKKDTVRVILVMEKCKGDLKSHIFESAPGTSEGSNVVRMTCRWVQEITDALAYIHERGIVHRDLKLENILLSNENSVKIADVGLAKQAVDILGTIAGTPLYMAPEVFHSQLYNSQADIYSLGMILWEMWYGKRALIPAETLPTLFAMVDEGYRPADVRGCKPPPECWKELMEKCWKGNPEERPTAESCKKEAKLIVSFFEEGHEAPAGF